MLELKTFFTFLLPMFAVLEEELELQFDQGRLWLAKIGCQLSALMAFLRLPFLFQPISDDMINSLVVWF